MNLIRKYFENLIYPERNFETPRLGFKEAMLLSWPFYIFSRIILLFLIFLSLKNLSSIQELGSIAELRPFIEKLDFVAGMKFATSMVSLGILFFPLTLFAEFVVWRFIFRSLSYFTNIEFKEDEDEYLIASGFSSHILTIIPFLGPLFQGFWQCYQFVRNLTLYFHQHIALSLLIVLFPYILKIGLYVILAIVLSMM